MSYTLNRDPKSGRWHLYFLDREGLRVRKTTKQTDKRKAVAVADDIYRRYGDPTYRAANEATLATGATALIEHLTNKGRSKETIDNFYQKKLGHLFRVLNEDRSLSTVDAKLVDSYIADRRKEGAKSYTISKELTALRMLLKVARRRGEFDKEVSQVMPIGFATKYKPRERKVTREEAWRLIHELPESAARYVAFVAATTARDSAVTRALGKHLQGDFVKVYDFKTRRSLREVPITKLTREFVDYAFRDIGEDDHVVVGSSSVRHALDRACRRLSLCTACRQLQKEKRPERCSGCTASAFAHISPNDIRRSAAHWLQLEGVPLPVIAGVMGHADTRMLERVYGKLDPRELARMLEMTLEGSWKNRRGSKETEETEEAKTS